MQSIQRGERRAENSAWGGNGGVKLHLKKYDQLADEMEIKQQMTMP